MTKSFWAIYHPNKGYLGSMNGSRPIWVGKGAAMRFPNAFDAYSYVKEHRISSASVCSIEVEGFSQA